VSAHALALEVFWVDTNTWSRVWNDGWYATTRRSKKQLKVAKEARFTTEEEVEAFCTKFAIFGKRRHVHIMDLPV